MTDLMDNRTDSIAYRTWDNVGVYRYTVSTNVGK